MVIRCQTSSVFWKNRLCFSSFSERSSFADIIGVSVSDTSADMAIVVADAWQRQGVGTRLVAALAERAASEGIEGFAVDIQGDNYGALKLFKRVAPGVRMTFSAGVGEAVIPL